ncbi:HNH endonuclease [Sphingomonas melonis]
MNTKKVKTPRPGTKTNFEVQETIDFLKSRSIETEAGCLEWQGPKTRDGYGQLGEYWIIEQYNIKLVHRLMVHLVTGHKFTSRSEQVMHSCHNRSCCNPHHLSIGTAKENVRQAWERGSFDSHNIVKLNADKVRDIRARYAAGERQQVLADDFGVTTCCISKVCTRKSWRHVA